jgi:hypothetical protein
MGHCRVCRVFGEWMCAAEGMGSPRQDVAVRNPTLWPDSLDHAYPVTSPPANVRNVRELSAGVHVSKAVSLCHPVVPVFDSLAMITRDELLG